MIICVSFSGKLNAGGGGGLLRGLAKVGKIFGKFLKPGMGGISSVCKTAYHDQ